MNPKSNTVNSLSFMGFFFYNSKYHHTLAYIYACIFGNATLFLDIFQFVIKKNYNNCYQQTTMCSYMYVTVCSV